MKEFIEALKEHLLQYARRVWPENLVDAVECVNDHIDTFAASWADSEHNPTKIYLVYKRFDWERPNELQLIFADEQKAQEWIAMVAAAPQAPEVSQWRDIETAPRDGTSILMSWVGEPSVEGFWMADENRNHWGEIGWFTSSDDVLITHPMMPTHWMPLPEGPKS